MKIERYSIRNRTRGKATVLSEFNVNFGPVTIRGFELVKAGNNVFVAVPHNYNSNTKNRFDYVIFNGGRGKQAKSKLEEMAKSEYRRLSGAAQAAPSTPQQQESFGGDGGGGDFDFGGGDAGGGGDDFIDDLPF